MIASALVPCLSSRETAIFPAPYEFKGKYHAKYILNSQETSVPDASSSKPKASTIVRLRLKPTFNKVFTVILDEAGGQSVFERNILAAYS